MAITFVTQGGSSGVKTSANSLGIAVPAGGHSAGNTLLVVFTQQVNTAGTISCADAAGNTYTKIYESGTAAQSCPHVAVFASVLTASLAASQAITVTTTGTFNRAGATTAEFSGLSVVADVAGASSESGAATTASPSAGPITPPSAQTLVIGALGLIGPFGDTFTQDSDTVGGSAWSALTAGGTSGGSAAANITVRCGWKITSSSAAQTYNPGLGTARQTAIAITALQPAAVLPQIAGSSAAGASGSLLVVAPTGVALAPSTAAASGSMSLALPVPLGLVAAAAAGNGALALQTAPLLALSAAATGVATASIVAATRLVLVASLAAGATSASLSVAMLLGLAGAGAVASPSATVAASTSVGFQQASGSTSGTLSISTTTAIGFQSAAAAGVGSLAVLVAQQLAMSDAAVAVGALALTAPSWVSPDQASAVSGGALAVTAPGALALAASTAIGSGALVLRIRTLLRPNGDVLTGWASDQATHFGALDDAVEQPTAPSTSSDLVFAANTGQIDRLAFDDAAISGTADGTLWVYAQATGLGVTIELYKGVTLVNSVTLPAGTAAGWVPIAFSGLTQTEVNSLEMRLVT